MADTRGFFASTFDFLASAPNDGLLLDEAGYLPPALPQVDAVPARKKMCVSISAAQRVRWASVRIRAMYRASRGRSDASSPML